jgi:hypothetical protein
MKLRQRDRLLILVSKRKFDISIISVSSIKTGVADPDPLLRGTDPDPSMFYHQAKTVRKPLIPIVL